MDFYFYHIIDYLIHVKTDFFWEMGKLTEYFKVEYFTVKRFDLQDLAKFRRFSTRSQRNCNQLLELVVRILRKFLTHSNLTDFVYWIGFHKDRKLFVGSDMINLYSYDHPAQLSSVPSDIIIQFTDYYYS